MNNSDSGLYKAGLIINIVFGVFGFVSLMGVGIWGLTTFNDILSDNFFDEFRGPGSNVFVALIVIAFVVYFLLIVFSSIALHLTGDTTRKRTRAFGILAGIWGLFTTPFLLGGIFTLVGVSSINKQKNYQGSSRGPQERGRAPYNNQQGPTDPPYTPGNDSGGFVPRDTGL